MTANRQFLLIVAGLSLGPAISNGIARFAYGLVLPAMKNDLGWNYALSGWINTANAIGYLAGALLAFLIMPSLGPKRVFLWGMGLLCVSLLMTGITDNILGLSFARVLSGVGGAPVFIAGGTLASGLYPEEPGKNAFAISAYFGGAGIGMLLSGIFIPHILGQMGDSVWPHIWIGGSVFSAMCFFLTLQTLRYIPDTASGSKAVSADTPEKPIPYRQMLPAAGGYFLFALGYIVYITFLVAWMTNNGAGVSLVSMTWSVMAIFVMISPFPWRSVLARHEGGGALAAACLMTGAATLILILIQNNFGLLLSASLFGVSFFIAPSAVTSFSRKNLAQHQWGKGVAFFTIVFSVGQMIGPMVAGLVGDWTSSLETGILGAGCLLVIGSLLAVQQKPLRGR